MSCYLDGMSNGDVFLRLGPDHERLRKAAAAEGISMSQFLREGMELRIDAAQQGSTSLADALRLVEKAARMLAEAGPVPELGTAEGDHWDRMLSGGEPG